VVSLYGKSQEYRCLAGIAAIHKADMFWMVFEKIVRVRHRLRAHVRIDTAIRALKTDLLVIFEQEPLIPVQHYRHLRSLLFDAKCIFKSIS
jgi:hypothetical protein